LEKIIPIKARNIVENTQLLESRTIGIGLKEARPTCFSQNKKEKAEINDLD